MTMVTQFLPMDLACHIATGEEVRVNSANYFDENWRPMFSICEPAPDWSKRRLFYFDECELVSRPEIPR